MSASELTALEELLSDLEQKALKASPGPWHIGHVSEHDDTVDIDAADGTFICEVPDRANQTFVCSANPETIKKLIAIIRRQQEALEECKIVLHTVEMTVDFALKDVEELAKGVVGK